MARRTALRGPAMTDIGSITSTLNEWAPVLNEFLMHLGEQVQTLSDAGATPSVRTGAYYEITNTAAQNVTNLTNGKTGQNVVLQLDANTTIVHDVTKISTITGANITGPITLSFWLGSDGVWYEEGV